MTKTQRRQMVRGEAFNKIMKIYHPKSNHTVSEFPRDETLKLQAQYLRFHTPKIAVYPGSFNPLHKGHWDIFQKACKIFDKVIFVFAKNYEKTGEEPIIPSSLSNVQVEIVQGSLIEWINKLPYPVTIIRGLRNSSDVAYEQNYLFWLKEIAHDNDLKVVSIFCDKQLEHISSSSLRVLKEVNAEIYNEYILP